MFRSRTQLLHSMVLLFVSIASLLADATAQTITFSRLDRNLPLDVPATEVRVGFFDFLTFDPLQIATEDFNKDGNLDLAFSDKVQSQVFVMLGNGNGTFGSEVGFGTHGPASSLVTGDFNTDGNPDLALAVPSRNSVDILFGTGTGSFSSALELPTGVFSQSPLALAAGDFDLDGNQDLMTVSAGFSIVHFLKSNGNGTFGPYTPAGNLRDEPVKIITADFNLDGNLDVATTNFNPFVSVALGTGAGTLQDPLEIPNAGGSLAVTTGDLDRDGFLDLAFLHMSPALPGTLSILLGNGDGTFGPARMDRSTGIDPRAILMGDFNLDGDLDIVVANLLSNTVSIFPGTDDMFQIGPSQDFSLFDKPVALASGDFNNDCRPDLAVLTAGNRDLVMLLNTTSKPPLEIVGLELSNNVLWPPNHKMVDVTVDYSVTNNCGPTTCVLTVVSNEPINGTGDGDSAPDWEIIDEHQVRLRAERAGKGSGRIYTITITCTDSTGSSSSRAVTVTVPKNQRR